MTTGPRTGNGPAAPPTHNNPAAACRSHDPDRWFPDRYDSAEARQAQNICWGCPLRRACADYALHAGEHDGIWGATTPDERRREVARRVRASRWPGEHAGRAA